MSILIKGMDEIPEDGAVLVVKHDNGKAYIKHACTYGYSMELVKLPAVQPDHVADIGKKASIPCAHENDLIFRQAAIDALKGLPTWWADEGGYYGGAQPPMVALLDPEDAVSAIENLPSAQPPTNCSEIPNGSDDTISRQAAIDAVGSMLRRKFGIGGDLAEITLAGLPSAQPDHTADIGKKVERTDETAQNVQNEDLISRKWLVECIEEGWVKFDTAKDCNRMMHLVRDIAPSVQPEQNAQDEDLISREAAIEALARMMPRSYTPDGSHPADEEIFRAQEVFADCIEALEILPSAAPSTAHTTETTAETTAPSTVDLKCSETPKSSERTSETAQPEKQHGRIFQEIVVRYPSYNPHPERKGKPYFLIKYTENGQEFIGYGTYKPEVLSEYLKEYFMPSAQPEQPTVRVEDDA